MAIGDRYTVAHLIGDITHHAQLASKVIMLLGPGRWGTTTPALGVPVSFVDINKVAILCEIVAMRDNLVPDVSLGTHFFHELVENDMLYLALFPNKDGNLLNTRFLLETMPNRLEELLPAEAQWAPAVRVLSSSDLAQGKALYVYADTLLQRVVGAIGDHVEAHGTRWRLPKSTPAEGC
jgi:hypothetical protein